MKHLKSWQLELFADVISTACLFFCRGLFWQEAAFAALLGRSCGASAEKGKDSKNEKYEKNTAGKYAMYFVAMSTEMAAAGRCENQILVNFVKSGCFQKSWW